MWFRIRNIVIYDLFYDAWLNNWCDLNLIDWLKIISILVLDIMTCYFVFSFVYCLYVFFCILIRVRCIRIRSMPHAESGSRFFYFQVQKAIEIFQPPRRNIYCSSSTYVNSSSWAPCWPSCCIRIRILNPYPRAKSGQPRSCLRNTGFFCCRTDGFFDMSLVHWWHRTSLSVHCRFYP